MNKFYRATKKIFGGLFKLIYRIKVVNPEKEVLDKPYIVCANHTSLMDVVAMVIAGKSS